MRGPGAFVTWLAALAVALALLLWAGVRFYRGLDTGDVAEPVAVGDAGRDRPAVTPAVEETGDAGEAPRAPAVATPVAPAAVVVPPTLGVATATATRQKAATRQVPTRTPTSEAEAAATSDEAARIRAEAERSRAQAEARAAETERRDRERAEREAALARGREKARGRKHFDVRGIRLWMQFEEVQAALDGAGARWQSEPTPAPAEAPYHRRSARAELGDGAALRCDFTSAVSGSRLYVVVYEQNLRDGPTPADLLADLEAKYGPPDEAKDTGAYWATYYLESAAEPIQAYGPLGAFFKVHFRRDREGRVEFLRLVFNDASLDTHDERAIYAARQDAKRREFERRGSKEATF